MKNLSALASASFLRPAAFILIFFCQAFQIFALTPDDLANNQKTHQAAMDLVRQQKTQDAVTYLSANIRSDESGARRDLAVAQELVGMACDFQNHHERAEAHAAAETALGIIRSLPLRAERDPRMGHLFSNAGLMCELVLNDPVMAKKLYETSLRVHPENKPAHERLELMRHKRHDRKPGGNATPGNQ